jgi:glucan biosynthesis protein C
VHQAEWLQWPMLFVNRWRMDLIFLISGVASAYLLKTDHVLRFLWQRHWRLVLPLVFGMIVVIPIQPYAQGVSNGLVEPGFWHFLKDYFGGKQWPEGAFDGWDSGFTWNHLWYLAYLWMYTLALAVIAKPLASTGGRKLAGLFTGLRGRKLLVLPAVPLFLFTVILQPMFPEDGDFIHDWYRNAVYFTVFLYGYLVARDAEFWKEVLRLRRISLGLALLTFTPYVFFAAIMPDDIPYSQQLVMWALRNFYIWTALLAILGWGHALLNRPFHWLPWANESVYPWYILHQSLIVGLGFWIADYRLGPVAEPALLLAGTVIGCFAISEIVKRIPILRPFFGLKARVSTRPGLSRSATRLDSPRPSLP